MDNDRILVLGEHGIALSNIAERTRQLGFRVVRARTFDDAIYLSRQRSFRYQVALIDPYMPIGNLFEAIRELKEESRSPTLASVAVGPTPEPEIREWLRDSDVSRALWDPVGDHALRFQLNSAMAANRRDAPRGSVRVPTEWRARVFTAGREKPASVYSLSGEGVFLETSRPSVSGAEVGIEIPLPSGNVTLAGRVVYTNVPGNLQCDLLPLGMAIRFTNPPSETAQAITRSVVDSASHFVV